jgi:hypothetical protein
MLTTGYRCFKKDEECSGSVAFLMLLHFARLVGGNSSSAIKRLQTFR